MLNGNNHFVDTPWTDRFATRAEGLKSSVIRELLKLTQDPQIISFAGGLPAPEVFPLERVEEACHKVLAEQGAKALQYSTTEGFQPLREMLVRHMERYGIHVTPANVLITSGSQQALDLIGKLLVNSGDRLLIEAPTYLGALQAFNAYQARYLKVPIDADGLRVDLLEEELRSGPKFLYVLPNFHNPAGTTLPLERRRRIVELASHYGVPILEDDPYGQLRYEGEHQPPLVEIDAELHGATAASRPFRGGVIYLSTFSKTLAPGLRVAWVVAPEDVIHRLVQMKQGADLHTSTFSQMVAYETARGGFLDQHVRRIREVYGERRAAMLAALDRHMPLGVEWTRPQGGLFLWLTLPDGLDSEHILREAIASKVAFVPGRAFYAGGGGERSMRLNFSYCTPDVIEEGIRRLAQVVDKALAAPTVAVGA
ncbi:MAG: PLP-dependent aminotransferase family protein [Acidobacteria bacterium]|nr:PLP-dependent aminotransferase family protein [Acidobacteriota bacterium]MCB9377727.1 PLP-dependent aminotransferase family protein [Holophagales bacterium]